MGILHRLRRQVPGQLSSVPRIAVIPGDGIGPEVIEAAIPPIEKAGLNAGLEFQWELMPYGADHYLRTGETLPEASFEQLKTEYDAIFLGALGDPRVPGNEHARDILLGLRSKLDLYINFRPCMLLHPSLCPLRPDRHTGIDFVIYRENTEGSYLGRGYSKNEGTPEEERVSEEVHTARGVERIIRAAFEFASTREKKLVTMADKSNAIPAHFIWLEKFEEIGAEFPEIQREHRYIDALAMELVRSPSRFDVIVSNNLYGDILSDLGAELVGGLGLAASANLHPGRPGLFEPVHGSAPTLAGNGTANPMASILAGALMLHELGAPDAAQAVEKAVRAALEEKVTTPDMNGDFSTREVARWITDRI